MIQPPTLIELEARIAVAEMRFGPFTSTHEALGVVMEEFAELLDAKQRQLFEAEPMRKPEQGDLLDETCDFRRTS